ncbi:hypothetical protein BBJ28_00007939 [Nothophytophthora sp. Chile5]|nr:hypothetical protein BBJ28_00007939 [Nothophytophthora sp. Chile5]
MAMATPPAPSEWRGTSDHNVTETAFDAVKCKLSTAAIICVTWRSLAAWSSSWRNVRVLLKGILVRASLRALLTICCLADAKTATSRVNIVSLGAGFDTLFFRLLQQQQTGNIVYTEVDCAAIVDAKASLLSAPETRQRLFPSHPDDVSVAASSTEVAWQCRVSSATYSLLECDLGDVRRLDELLTAAGVDKTLPTLILAECVVSYLAPEKGTELLQWLAEAFPCGSIALYDPIGLQANSSGEEEDVATAGKKEADAFGATLQRYFAVKGCTLRGARGFRTAADHARRLLALGRWRRCRILDMNGVFAACTSIDERKRLATLEPFDEFADWALCNAHYALYLADNGSDSDVGSAQWMTRFVPRGQQRHLLLTASALPRRHDETASSPVAIVRSFQHEDLEAVRSLFESSHLEFAQGSRAVRQFVVNRLRNPTGDMADVAQSFQPQRCGPESSGFWVAEVAGQVVGCVGLKPLAVATDRSVAELCRLSVAPAFRRRGLASVLVGTAESLAASCGMYGAIRLETIGAMEGAQQLYRSLGYQQQEAEGEQGSSSRSFTLVRFQKTLKVAHLL